eukprot:scaffold8667_cov112-Isochrysis_galbana.AAC.4
MGRRGTVVARTPGDKQCTPQRDTVARHADLSKPLRTLIVVRRRAILDPTRAPFHSRRVGRRGAARTIRGRWCTGTCPSSGLRFWGGTESKAPPRWMGCTEVLWGVTQRPTSPGLPPGVFVARAGGL